MALSYTTLAHSVVCQLLSVLCLLRVPFIQQSVHTSCDETSQVLSYCLEVVQTRHFEDHHKLLSYPSPRHLRIVASAPFTHAHAVIIGRQYSTIVSIAPSAPLTVSLPLITAPSANSPKLIRIAMAITTASSA